MSLFNVCLMKQRRFKNGSVSYSLPLAENKWALRFFFFVEEAYNNDVRNDERRLVRLRTVGWCERGCHNRRKYHESGYNKLSDFLTEIIHYK